LKERILLFYQWIKALIAVYTSPLRINSLDSSGLHRSIGELEMSNTRHIDELNFGYSCDSDLYRWNKGKEYKLSDNFSTYEFECSCDRKDCREQFLRKGLVDKLQLMRDQTNEPIRVNSGYRCKEYQEKLRKKGLPTAKKVSQHELGGAVDITSARTGGNPGPRFAKFTIIAEGLFDAIGYAKGWLHVDMRSDKKRTWTY